MKRKSSVSKLQISAPVELISTTNMISYTAPTLHNSPLSSTSPSTNGRFFPFAATSPASSPPTSDAESPSPPTSPTAVRLNHLSTYFSSAPVPPPMSPARSLSTRSNFVKRSDSTSSTSPKQRRSQPPPRVVHRGMDPFGRELAQVSEVAEVYGLRGIGDDEEEFMYEHGLQKFCADDYLREIGHFGGAFNDEFPRLNPGWI